MSNLLQPICITGANGFLGRHLVAELKNLAGYQLNALTRNIITPTDGYVELFRGDLLDEQSLEQFIKPGAIVIHLAYINENSFTKNKDALQSLTKVSKKKNIKHFIHISTAVVAGRISDAVITEETTCNPVTPYEKVKLACEKLLISELSASIPLTILRPTAIFGEHGKNLNKLIDDFLLDKPYKKLLRAFILGSRPLHLVPVKDVINATLLVLTHPPAPSKHQCFIVSADDATINTYAGFYQKITAMTKTKPQRLPFYAPKFLQTLLLKLKGHSQVDSHQRFSNQQLLQSGFEKAQPFDQALARYIQFYLRKKGAL